LKFTYSTLFIGVLVVFFLCLDVQLYKKIQHESRFNITITVKAVMLDHVNTYLLQPLSELLVETTRFPALFPSISANHISYLGVVFAFVAARLVISDHLYIRRIGVLAFLVRQFLDDLDGLVARYHLGIDAKKQVSLPHTSGYIVDGICDGIGFIVFWFAVLLHANNRTNASKSKSNVLLSNSTYSLLQSPTQPTNYYKRRLIKHYLLVLAQMAVSSLFWNLFLIKYHRVLDPDLTPGFDTRTPLQDEIFKSSLLFTIMWLWRCLNPHALSCYFLIAVWLNQQTQYSKRSSQYIFWILAGVSILCEVHFQDIKYRLDMTY